MATEKTITAVVEAYMELLRAGPAMREDLMWAAEEFHDWIRYDPETGWAATVMLVERAVDDRDLVLAGTGPIEHLLADHGNLLAARAAVLASTSPRFAAALRAADLSDFPELRRQLRMDEF